MPSLYALLRTTGLVILAGLYVLSWPYLLELAGIKESFGRIKQDVIDREFEPGPTKVGN